MKTSSPSERPGLAASVVATTGSKTAQSLLERTRMQVATAVLAVLGLLLVVAGLTVVALFRDHGGLPRRSGQWWFATALLSAGSCLAIAGVAGWWPVLI